MSVKNTKIRADLDQISSASAWPHCRYYGTSLFISCINISASINESPAQAILLQYKPNAGSADVVRSGATTRLSNNSLKAKVRPASPPSARWYGPGRLALH